MTGIIGYGYGTLVIIGGLVGYLKAGSKISLMAGLISGLLALWGSYRVSNNPKDVYLLLAVSSLLLGVMGPRFYRGRKMMPAGLVTLMSIIMIIYYGSRLL